jgi:hypothetical protein
LPAQKISGLTQAGGLVREAFPPFSVKPNGKAIKSTLIEIKLDSNVLLHVLG